MILISSSTKLHLSLNELQILPGRIIFSFIGYSLSIFIFLFLILFYRYYPPASPSPGGGHYYPSATPSPRHRRASSSPTRSPPFTSTPYSHRNGGGGHQQQGGQGGGHHLARPSPSSSPYRSPGAGLNGHSGNHYRYDNITNDKIKLI